MGKIGTRRAGASAGWLLVVGMAGPAVAATDYAVSGSATFNGNASALGDGQFLGSSYTSATGVIGAGTFKFQGASVGNAGTSLTYHLDQSIASAGQVGADGLAALADASMRLTVVGLTLSGTPRAVGTDCVFEPIHIVLDGNGSASGLELSATGFSIAPIDPNACNGFATAINNLIAGNANSIALRVEGNFSPPGTIFTAGFESVR
ncbi:hypothetical protein [Dokdonella sp.]|uniref:hypothetical protein n=1 Tax=Dokdonella sp. TaxID=2291710 RepID=UPI0037838C6F